MGRVRAVAAAFLVASGLSVACDGSKSSGREASYGFPGTWHPVVEIGVMEGPPVTEVFGAIRRAVLMESGGVAVLDVQASRVTGFDGDGEYDFSFGRSGSGPGEFASPTELLQIADDTLVVVDRGRRSINYFVRRGVGAFAETDRFVLPFWPNGACFMEGKIFLLGNLEGFSVHEMDAQGSVRRSFLDSELGEWAEGGSSESVAWAWRDEAVSGRLVCSEEARQVVHIPLASGWVRAYTLDGDVAWHATLADFAKVSILPAVGGVKYDIDPALGFAHGVIGAALAERGVLGISMEKSFPRGQESSNEVLLVLLDLATGNEIGSEPYSGVLTDGSGLRTVVVHDTPFPRVTVLGGPSS